MRLLSCFTSPVTVTIVVYPGVVAFHIAKLMPPKLSDSPFSEKVDGERYRFVAFADLTTSSALNMRQARQSLSLGASKGSEGDVFKKYNPESDDNLIELALVKAPKNIEANSRRPGFINFAKG